MFPSQPSNADPLVIQVLREHRAGLDAADVSLSEDMGRRWLQIERGLDADIAALAQEMARRTAAGETITQQMVWRAQRYQILKAKLTDEIRKYNKEYAVDRIATAQRQFSTIGIRAAQDAIVANYPSPLSAAFNQINIGAVESLIGFAGDGSPLYSLLKEDFPDAVDGLVDALVNGLARGLGPGQIGRDMADGMGMGLDRSLLIARTEAARAYRTGSVEQYRQSGVVEGFMRLVKKETACPACLLLDGERFALEEELTDHPRGKAELPDNLIVSSSPSALETFRYNGDIVVITLASGKFLTVTPNHPVLTDRGWVAAKFINKTDNVISYGGSEWTSNVVSPDKNHIPTQAKNLAGAFGMLRLGRVPESAKYLYGDGTNSEVDVIFINRLLWNSFNAPRQKQVRQFFFGNGSVGLGAFNPLRSLQQKASILFNSSYGINGGLNSRLALSLAHSSPSIVGGSGRPARLNPVLGQYSSNDVARNAELFSNRLLGMSPVVSGTNGSNVLTRKDDFVTIVGGQLSGLNFRSFGFIPKQPLTLEQIREGLTRSMPTGGDSLDTVPSKVVFDSVVNVDFRGFSGHVYSFQTKEEWYISNGIVSHNCTAIPIVEGVDPPQYQTGKEWFLEQDEATQKKILGPQKWQLWQDNDIPLERFAQHAHSDVWGSSPRPATIEELTQ